MDIAWIDESPDDDAMRQLAEGDSAALALLFERHKQRLLAYLSQLVRNEDLAEDLLVETFLRVYQSCRRYRSGSGFTPWLYRIGRNLALGELRRRAVAERVRQLLGRGRDAAGGDWRPEQSDDRAQVRAALAGLPEDQRSALVLREYHELDYREIGQILDCSEEAARARAYRARAALREDLRDWWEER